MEQLQSHMPYGLLIYGEIFALFLIYYEALPSSYMTLQLLHSDTLNFLIQYIRKNVLSFLSVYSPYQPSHRLVLVTQPTSQTWAGGKH